MLKHKWLLSRFPFCYAMFASAICLLLTGCIVRTTSEDSDTLADSTSFEISESEPAVEKKHEILTIADARYFIDTCSMRARYMSGIIPQMIEDAPTYAIKLLKNKHDRFLVVDKYRMKVLVFNKYGVEEASYGMACAKNYGTKHKKADSRTPEGFFSVQGVYNSTEWLFTDDDGNTSEKKGQFGPRFIRLNIPITSQIGIHGTCAPWSIGGRSSHGCIRIHNDNIMKLVELVDSGMPVIITPGLRDMKVNIKENCNITSISTIVGKKAPSVNASTVADEEEHTIEKVDETLTNDTTVCPEPNIEPAEVSIFED